MLARAVLVRRSPRLVRAEEPELAAPGEEKAGERAAPAPDPMMTVDVHDAESANNVQELQPPEEPLEGREWDLRWARVLKRKAAEYDEDDNNRSNSARNIARMRQDKRDFHRGPGGHPESDEEQNDYRGDDSDDYDDDEEEGLDAPKHREAMTQMATLLSESLKEPEEPARAPAGGCEQDARAQDDGQSHAEMCRELKETKANDALAAVEFVKAILQELEKAEEKNHRLVGKNNNLITLRQVAEKKLLDAGREGHVCRAKQELVDAKEDLRLQSAEYRDLKQSVARYQLQARRARSQRDDAKQREERSTSERNEAEGLLAKANATIQIIKGERNRAEKRLGEADNTLKTVLHMCNNRDRDKVVDLLDEADATIASIQYMCETRES
jgi:hypothetical protein